MMIYFDKTYRRGLALEEAMADFWVFSASMSFGCEGKENNNYLVATDFLVPPDLLMVVLID